MISNYLQTKKNVFISPTYPLIATFPSSLTVKQTLMYPSSHYLLCCSENSKLARMQVMMNFIPLMLIVLARWYIRQQLSPAVW